MSIRETILSRRSIFRFREEPLSTEVVVELVRLGTWAPNHHLTEPWRFTLIGEQTKLQLAQRYRKIQMEKVADHVSEAHRAQVGEAGYRKFMSKPTILAVSCLQEGDAQQQLEDYAATCCAIQNIQLAAWERGIGVQWSTGPITREEATVRLLGLDPRREKIVGFLYMGYPAEVPRTRRRDVWEVFRQTS